MPDPIRSERLELVPLPVGALEALLAGSSDLAPPAGWPDEHDASFLRLRARQLRESPEREEWSVRAVMLLEPERRMVGHAGFHGPPGVNGLRAEDAVEIGYTIFPADRGRGYAVEAAQALVDWAHRERGIRHFVASVSPSNEPSLAIVRKLGFVETGSQWDEEDGEELVFELRR